MKKIIFMLLAILLLTNQFLFADYGPFEVYQLTISDMQGGTFSQNTSFSMSTITSDSTIEFKNYHSYVPMEQCIFNSRGNTQTNLTILEPITNGKYQCHYTNDDTSDCKGTLTLNFNGSNVVLDFDYNPDLQTGNINVNGKDYSYDDFAETFFMDFDTFIRYLYLSDKQNLTCHIEKDSTSIADIVSNNQVKAVKQIEYTSVVGDKLKRLLYAPQVDQTINYKNYHTSLYEVKGYYTTDADDSWGKKLFDFILNGTANIKEITDFYKDTDIDFTLLTTYKGNITINNQTYNVELHSNIQNILSVGLVMNLMETTKNGYIDPSKNYYIINGVKGNDPYILNILEPMVFAVYTPYLNNK